MSETTPPAPSVFATGKPSDGGFVSATWNNPGGQVDSYKYAIGATRGGSDVLNWTTTGNTLLHRTGLALVKGTTYWVSVKAHSQTGPWGSSGSVSFVAGKTTSRMTYLPSIQRQK